MLFSRRLPIIFAVVLFWLVTVVALYFVAHKPASSEQLSALIGWLPALLINVGVWIVAAGVGYRFLGRWGHPDQRAVLSIGLGLGIYSGLTVVLGLIGLLRIEIAWLLIALGLIIGARSIREWWCDLRGAIGALHPTSPFARLAMGYCLVVLIISFLQALTPPAAWDALAYHLVIPELYQSAGRITHPIDLPYLGFPQFGEMLFLFVRVLGSQNPGMLHWIFAVMTTLFVASEARRMWGDDTAWIAGAIFLSAETVVLEAGWPYIDLMLAFQTLAATMCLLRWRAEHKSQALIWMGVFTGFALATKYSAVSLVVGILLAMLLRRGSGRLRSIAIVVGLAGLVASPWYIKNWLVEGNPFYPMLLGGPYWDSVRGQGFSRLGTGLAVTAPWQLLTVPWDMTIWGVEGKVGYAATLGPLFLMLMPIVALGWRTLDLALRAVLRGILLVCAGMYVAWLVGLASSELFMQARLLVPLLPLLALVSVGAFPILRRFDRPTVSLRRIAVVLTSLVLLATGMKVSLDFMGSGTLKVLSGAQSTEAYLTDHLGWYYIAMQSMRDLGSDARVLFLWEPRSLYCTADCRPDSLIDNWWHARRTIGSPDQIAAAWQAAGVQYLLLNRVGYEAAIQLNLLKPTNEDQQALQDLIAHHLQFVRSFGAQYELYRWK